MSCSLLRTWPKLRFWIWLRMLSKLESRQKNKRKLKLLWLKLISSGNPESSTLLLGAKGKMLSWLASVSRRLLRDLKRTKWHWVQSMHKGTWSHSRRELSSWSGGSLILLRPLTSGSKCKSSGQVYNQCSQEATLPSKCLCRPSNSTVSTRRG